MVNMSYALFLSGKLVDPALRDRMVEEVLTSAMGYLIRDDADEYRFGRTSDDHSTTIPTNRSGPAHS